MFGPKTDRISSAARGVLVRLKIAVRADLIYVFGWNHRMKQWRPVSALQNLVGSMLTGSVVSSPRAESPGRLSNRSKVIPTQWDQLREFDVREIGAGFVNIYQLGRFSEEILLRSFDRDGSAECATEIKFLSQQACGIDSLFEFV